jgi:hypothetical protein
MSTKYIICIKKIVSFIVIGNTIIIPSCYITILPAGSKNGMSVMIPLSIVKSPTSPQKKKL